MPRSPQSERCSGLPAGEDLDIPLCASPRAALGVAQLVLKAYSVTMADAWDYRDTTTPYDDATGEYDQQGLPRPTVNSHYGRHTIFWAIPLALTGQQYDARERTLRFAPHPEAFVPALFSSPKTACVQSVPNLSAHHARFTACICISSFHQQQQFLELQ